MRLLVVGDYRVVSEDVGSKKDGHGKREPKHRLRNCLPTGASIGFLHYFCSLLYCHLLPYIHMGSTLYIRYPRTLYQRQRNIHVDSPQRSMT